MARIYNYFAEKWIDEWESESFKIKKIFQTHDNNYVKSKFYQLKREQYKKSHSSHNRSTSGKYNYQVMFKISSSCSSYEHLYSHIKYITRNGSLEAIYYDPIQKTDYQKASRFQGKNDNKQMLKHINSSYALKTNSEITHLKIPNKETFNMIFSMSNYEVATTEQIRKAAYETIKELYANNSFIIASHNDTDNPHCHLILKRRNSINGKKLDIKKSDLIKIRLKYSQKLREAGVENAFTKDKPIAQEAYKEKYNSYDRSPTENLIVDFGKANYKFDEKNQMSYYIKYKTKNDKYVTIWGKDLERVVKENNLQRLCFARFAVVGQKPIQRTISKFDKKSNQYKCYQETKFEKVWGCSLSIDSDGTEHRQELKPLKKLNQNIYQEISQDLTPYKEKSKYTPVNKIYDDEFVIGLSPLDINLDHRNEYVNDIISGKIELSPYKTRYDIYAYKDSDTELVFEREFQKQKESLISNKFKTCINYTPNLLKYKGFEIGLYKPTNQEISKDSYSVLLQYHDKSYLIGSIEKDKFQDLTFKTFLKEIDHCISTGKYQAHLVETSYIGDILSPINSSKKLKLNDYESDKDYINAIKTDKENKITGSIAQAKLYVKEQEQKRKRDEELAKAKAKEQERKELERQKALLQEQIYKSRQIQIKNYITQRNDYEQRTNRIKPATLCRYRNLHISNFGNFADKSNGSIRQLPASRDNSMRIVSKFNMDFRLRKSNMLLSDNSQHNLRHTEQSKNNLYVRQQGDINQADTTTRALTTSKKTKKEIQSFER
ncbi:MULTISPECIES: relaxase/mobilization nuclease domain-containing protein [Campylobacter]|uniref:relaxase/mobilization nuclease domain-containing protein n=1 Tax=Campylobacter TaxID=194 RepID=UPI000A34AC0D|nr:MULTISPECIES: relaxase/mobilization nuclease domain-containing protein [unclassified Campylobacter]MCR8689741.1 relaxase/mobilization nuclease domain-containing protein [Campylobacter sp. RM9264]MCR8701317.1 relaxase/mobilization nuclease domain-containing protein [Campylobacter sp. RM12176]